MTLQVNTVTVQQTNYFCDNDNTIVQLVSTLDTKLFKYMCPKCQAIYLLNQAYPLISYI